MRDESTTGCAWHCWGARAYVKYSNENEQKINLPSVKAPDSTTPPLKTASKTAWKWAR